MNLAIPFFAAAVCLAPLNAQAPTARQFLLDEYGTVIRVDMKALRDTGVWDEMTVSTLNLVFSMLEQQFGFPLDRLDRVTSVRSSKRQDGEIVGSQEIVTIEGNGDLGETHDMRGGRYEEVEVGNYTLLQDQWSRDESLVQVTPMLRVYGPPGLLEPVLTGKPRTGLPSADVMSFTAGKKGLLLYAVADLRDGGEIREALDEALPDAGWPEHDQPTFGCLRLLATGDEDDPHLTLEAALRHGKAGAGIDASDKAVGDALARLGELTEARIIRPLLKKVERERDGTDTVWRVDLGRARQAAGLLGTLSPFMMFAGGREVQVMQAGPIEVVEQVEEPAPKPGPKKKVKQT